VASYRAHAIPVLVLCARGLAIKNLSSIQYLNLSESHLSVALAELGVYTIEKKKTEVVVCPIRPSSAGVYLCIWIKNVKLGGTVTNVTRARHGARRAGFRFKGSALTFLHSCRIEFRFLKRCLLDHIPVALLYNLKKKKVHIFFFV